MAENTTVWAFWVKTDSGDEHGPFVFNRELTDDELETFLRSEFSDEFVEEHEGPGDFDSYAYVTHPGYVQVRKV